MFPSELSLSLFFKLFSLFLSLSGLLISSHRGTFLCNWAKVGRVIDIDRASLTHKANLPMAITEALESLDFSGSAYKIPGRGSDWSRLDHVHMPKPIRMTREMVHCDWPGLDYCFSLGEW